MSRASWIGKSAKSCSRKASIRSRSCQHFHGVVKYMTGFVSLTDDLLRYEQCQLILSFCIELAKLDPSDLGSDVGNQVYDLCSAQEVRERRIGISAVIIVLKWLERRILLLRIPCWQVVWILCRRLFCRSLQFFLLLVCRRPLIECLFVFTHAFDRDALRGPCLCDGSRSWGHFGAVCIIGAVSGENRKD